jgi:chemotaxis protein MotB
MTRSRRKKFEDEELKPERWLVSYADFITLLFAFFVVMYAISSVNNEKYQGLSNALEQVFSHAQTVKVKEPIQIGEPPKVIQPIKLKNPTSEELAKRHQLSERILQERRQLQSVANQFEQVLQPYVKEDLVEVKRHDFWVELQMNSELLFASGEAALSSKAYAVLKKVAEVVKPIPNFINIEGHTDNVPIETLEFPSNWDLSSARATSVVRQFEQFGISSLRLAAVGYGEFHPVADNTTIEGRKKNRRVIVLLISQAFARYGMTDSERADLLNIETEKQNSVSEQLPTQ